MGVDDIHQATAVVASVTLALYAAILWIVAIRTIIGVVVLAVVCYVPCSMLASAAVIQDNTLATSWKTLGIVLSACVISAIAVAAIIFVRRYFFRVEWSRFV